MDAYRIGIAIALGGSYEGALAAFSNKLLGIHTSASKISKEMGKWGTIIAASASFYAGVKLFKGLEDVAEHAKALTHELVQIKKLNAEMTPGQFEEIKARAYSVTQNVPGVTVPDVLKTYGATYSMLGHENSIRMMEPLNKFAMAIGNTTGKFESAADDVYKMVRAGDMMGKFVDEKTHQVDVDRLTKFLDLGAKVIQGTEGKVSPQTWLGLAQQGGPALMGLSEKGTLTAAIMSQVMGGPRMGTAMMSTFQQWVGGQMTKRTALGLASLDLIDSKKMHEMRGGIMKMDKGALSPQAIKDLTEDPLKFAMEDIIPAMQKHGITTSDGMIKKLFEIFGRQTTQREYADLIRNLPQILNERDRLGRIMNIDKGNALANSEDMTQALHNMSKSYDKFMTELAGPNAQGLIWFINGVSHALDGLADFVHRTDPKVITGIFATLVGVATIFVAAPFVAFLVWLGAIPLAITAAAIALGVAAYEIYSHWDMIKAKAKSEIAQADPNLGVGNWGAAIKDGFVKAWQNQKAVFADMARWAAMAWNGALKQGFIDAWKNEKAVFADMGKLVTAAWDGIAMAFRSAVDKFVASVKSYIPGFGPGNSPWTLPKAGGASGSWDANPPQTGGANGSWDHPVPQKQSYNAIRPVEAPKLPPIKVTLMMDRRQMGEADIEYQVRQGAGPIAGSRYFDPVHGAPPFDTVSA